jgi:NAD(P)-dependent dehydrogenase (short-subunit alcohol dehydrogenase family)
MKKELKDMNKAYPVPGSIKEILPAVRMILTETGSKILSIRNSELIAYAGQRGDIFENINSGVDNECVRHFRSKFLYINGSGSSESVINKVQAHKERLLNHENSVPVIILAKNLGLIAAGDSKADTEMALDIMENLLIAGNDNGESANMAENHFNQMDSWFKDLGKQYDTGEMDNAYTTDQRIFIITGAAQGFGEGIARHLMGKKANVVIADVNEMKGEALVRELNKSAKTNRALFVRTDVSDAASVQNLMFETVRHFGGLDALISNAGILHAGDLDEMEPDTFDRMTRINYNGYFLCVKYASEILKIQAGYHYHYFTDILQINSKSGLKGSNRNFAYAGGKFGGIGLTQSFALELIPFRIKVNSICPGNYFDGPLWSDPVNGLFVQYLKTGKVPGAKNVEDVRRFYEAQVPAGRGCTVSDVMKAIMYAIDQQYETGQAIPVTGGQVMLR